MAAAKKVRLFKIASEINIGKETIVEFLQGKGFDIENKPTARLDEQMVEAVYDKFKREKRAAEVQREKIQKHKDQRRDAVVELRNKHIDEEELPEEQEPKAPPADEEPIEAQHEPEMKGSIKVEDTEEISPAAEEKAEEPLEEKTEEVPPEQTQAEEVSSEEVPVEAEAETQVPVEAEAETQVPEKEKLPAENIEIKNKESHHHTQGQPVTVMEDVSDEKPGESVDEIVTEEIPPRKEIEIDKGQKEKIEAEADIRKEALEETSGISPEEEAESEYEGIDTEPEEAESDEKSGEKAQEEEIKDKAPRKKKHHRKILEIDYDDSPKLRGLTVLGKIDIEKEKQAKKGKKKIKRKPVEEDEEQKLRRIERDKKGKKPAPKTEEARAKTPAKEKPAPAKEKPALTDKKEQTKEGRKEKDISRKKKKRRKSIREMISEEDVDKAIKQTLSGMEQSKISATKTKMRKRRLAEREEKEAKKQVEKERELQKLELTEYVTTSDLANLMGKTANDIILKCMELGLMVTINQRLDKDTIILIADDYGFEVEFHDEKEFQFIEEEEDREEDLKPRSPIVTIMGHVDHGKTSLLDHIRSENVVAGEAGGITQHIGAYKVELDAHRSITFLDTPGHEAFTAMRARGAQVTDIVVLVVAADDSVMPQTIEAISHAKAANVPIVVAINKIDKPDARPDRIKQQLSDHNILVEDWGGKYQSIELSAKSGLNVDQLLDKILLEAELLDLKANPDKGARGIVVEANMNKGLGPVATIIIQKGTLNIGDAFVSGVFSGRVRAMLDERGNKVDKAGPSVPVMVVGFDGLPEAGDQFVSVSSDSDARHIATERQQLKREQELRQIRHVTLDEISKQIQLGGVKDLFLVIKGDVSGSVEAISDSLQKLSREEVRVVILHKGVGAISESDVMLAAASHAVIIGFNISPTAQARKAAESEHVDIRLYDIIYDCINEVQLALEGLLSPEYKEETICTVEVRKVFKISRLGSIAGCYVLSGKITRNDKVRVLRDGLPVFDGGIASLKRGKDDVKEVDSGFECGIQLVGFNDFLEGDIIEGYRIVEVRRTLK